MDKENVIYMYVCMYLSIYGLKISKLEKEKFLSFLKILMNLKDIMVRKIIQKQKAKHCLSHLYVEF
jgi:hypothetical protein